MKKEEKFSEDSIRASFANKSLQTIPIFFYKSTDSTNTRAKLYENKEKSTVLFVANGQTAGRGSAGTARYSGIGTDRFPLPSDHYD